MALQNATPVALAFARYFARPKCPHCNDVQVAPDHSEFGGRGLVHHAWSCENCGHEFRTTVEFERSAA